jgi:hypothetical protein
MDWRLQNARREPERYRRGPGVMQAGARESNALQFA